MSAPSRTDPLAARASRAVGGAWGRRAAVFESAWWTPLRVLLAATAVTMLLGFAVKAPCTSGDWVGAKQYTHLCYSDVVPLWSAERLDVGAVPYRDTAVEYPPVTGGFMWVAATLTRGVHAAVSSWSLLALYGVLSAALLALCGLVVTGMTALTGRRRPYDAALFALSPLLVVHAFTNWDLLAMAFASSAMWAGSRRWPVATGVLLGLGTAAKLYPALLLVPLLVLAIRTRRWAPVLWAGAATGVSWVAVNLPLALAYRDGWSTFFTLNTDRPAERETLWAALRTLATAGTNPSDATTWTPPGAAVALALLAALLFVVWLGLNAPATPRVAQLAFLVVLAFLLTTKVWNPQYSLWLLPLIALARPRWRLVLVWQGLEAAIWGVKLTLLLGLDPARSDHGIGYGWMMLFIAARDAVLVAMAALVVREMWHPELDVVRADDSDDPHGGVFDHAPDWFIASSGGAADDRRGVTVGTTA